MQHGFIKVAAGTPFINIADCIANRQEIERLIGEMQKEGAKIMVFPELCLTGYDCRDLFYQDKLIKSAWEQLLVLVKNTEDVDALIFAGLPVQANGKLYDAAAAFCRGELLGIVPKSILLDSAESCETRTFTAAEEEVSFLEIEEDGETYEVPFGTQILFEADGMPHLKVAAEICGDLWAPDAPSTGHVFAGATVIANLAASDTLVGKDTFCRMQVLSRSASCLCGYIYAAAGEGESTTDLVFDAQNMIAENGQMLAEAKRFENETIYADIDVDRIFTERRKMSAFPAQYDEDYVTVVFPLAIGETSLTREFPKMPFVPDDGAERAARCDEILKIQAYALKKRLQHTHCTHAVVGISGGLDSTLALLVTAKAFDLLGLPREQIISVTMPGFGTTDRTYTNATTLTTSLGATLREVRIADSVLQHFKDIGHDVNDRNVTYENAQARERTQILMDIANDINAMVIGTGDLSELALGWATYNGDHMSMYGVNASIPKTLVRHLVRYYAETCGDQKIHDILIDVLDTPVSPELLPPTENGTISQKTEDLVGPYELHDFFLYYMLRLSFTPEKIYRLACRTFADSYNPETILFWLKKFYWRFFSQQFKRSCLADGPKVGSVGVSPRGDLRMPSDACVRIWIDECESLGK